MKIFLPFKITDVGGTATFAEKFTREITKKGYAIVNTFCSDFDILFIIADCPLWYPIYAKMRGRKIIQRLDGVHPTWRLGYQVYNLKMKIIHNFLADTIIYQSKFSRLSCETFLGETRAKQTPIIYNGVDTENIPSKTTLHSKGAPIKLLTFAKFRRQDQIKPIIESVKLLDPEKFTLDIYGSYTENLKSLFENLPKHIHFQGKKLNEELLQILHQYDIFLFSDQSACPNSVLEAMAAGLPVVAFNRGSISELIKPGYNGEIANIKEKSDQFRERYPFGADQYQGYSNEIQRISRDMDVYSKTARLTASEEFNIDQMIQGYINNAFTQK